MYSLLDILLTKEMLIQNMQIIKVHTVCPGSSDPSEKIFNIFAPENEKK